MPGVKQQKKNKKGPRPSKKQANGGKSKMPPRPWRDENHATKVLHEAGGKGTDIRSDSTSAVRELVTNAISAIRVRGFVKYQSLRSCAIGIVLDALKRGWKVSTFQPYYAGVYLYRTLISVCEGTFPALQSAPEWFWELTAALHPKTAPFKTGSLQCSWELTGINSFDPVVDLGSRHLVFGAPGVGDVNEYPILDVPAAYADDLGASAITELFKMYPESGLTGQRSLGYTETAMSKDTSAFATVYAEIGSAATTTGGIANTIQSERKIQSPIFSHFAEYQVGNEWRGFQEYRKDAGSPMSVIPRMIAGQSVGALRNKMSPIYKFIDFDEIYEQLTLTLCSAMELAVASNIGSPPPSCELSYQDVQLLLRQVLVGCMSNEYGCDLQYTSPSALDFLPFSVATNGYDYTMSNDAQFPVPQFLAESVRALTKKMCKITGRGRAQRLDVIPIVGRYDVTQLKNYTYNNGGVQTPIYADLGTEIPINLVELSAVVSGGTVYIDLNGEALQTQASKWNQWIVQLGSYLSPLTNIGREHGINALGNILFTTHSVVVPVIPPLETASATTALTLGKATSQAGTGITKKVSKVNVNPRSFGRVLAKSGYGLPAPDVDSTFYTQVQPAVITSMFPVYKAIWNVQKLMIFPTYIGETGLDEDGNVPAQQTFQVEPYSVPVNMNLIDQGEFPSVSTLKGDTLFLRHLEASKMDIRSPLQPMSESMLSFNALTETGRGGFFTALAGNFLEAVGVKGAKGVADAIGNATGW
jgi:hypothetical protein